MGDQYMLLAKKGRNMHDFTHPELHQEIHAIGGHYMFTKELRLVFKDKEVLILIGHGVYDTSCCGAGGCAYALVPGYIRNWKYKNAEDGMPVSQVDYISDSFAQNEIRRLLEKEENVGQVRFQE